MAAAPTTTSAGYIKSFMFMYILYIFMHKKFFNGLQIWLCYIKYITKYYETFHAKICQAIYYIRLLRIRRDVVIIRTMFHILCDINEIFRY